MTVKNKPLAIGSLVLALILLVMLFPDLFAPTNPYGLKSMRAYTDAQGSFVIETPPFEPSSGYPLGSDEMGRDVLSLILFGTRLTIGMSLLIVAARFLLSIPIGVSAGLGSFFSKTLINQFGLIFSALPALLISLIILKMGFFTSLFKTQSMAAFVVVLTFVGWHETAGTIARRVERLNREPFITGQRAIGKSDWSIAVQNVLPHLRSEILVMFFMEIARVLTLLMQLGVFEVFVGNLRIIMDTGYAGAVTASVTFEPEWSSMLGAARLYLRSAPWIVFYPAAAFFISVFGFNLFGEGLRAHFANRVPREEATGKRRGGKKRMLAAGAVLAVVLVAGSRLFVPDFNLETTRRTLGLPRTGTLISGSAEGIERAGLIAERLEAMGLEPVRGGEFLQVYEKPEALTTPLFDELKLEGPSGTDLLAAGKDYFADTFGAFDVSGPVYDGRRLDYYWFEASYPDFEGRWVLLDRRNYSREDMLVFAERILGASGAKGVLVADPEADKRHRAQGVGTGDGPVLTIGETWADRLAESEGILAYRQVPEGHGTQGVNILAKLKGRDPRIKEDIVLIGFSYHYQYEPIESGKIDFAFELIEQLIRKDANRDRTIVFAFFDDPEAPSGSGLEYFSDHLPFQQKKLTLYLDLTRLYGAENGRIVYNGDMAPLTRYYGWGFNRKMTSGIEGKGLPLSPEKPDGRTAGLLFDENGFTTIVAGFEPDPESSGTLEDFGNLVVKSLVVNHY